MDRKNLCERNTLEKGTLTSSPHSNAVGFFFTTLFVSTHDLLIRSWTARYHTKTGKDKDGSRIKTVQDPRSKKVRKRSNEKKVPQKIQDIYFFAQIFNAYQKNYWGVENNSFDSYSHNTKNAKGRSKKMWVGSGTGIINLSYLIFYTFFSFMQ